MPDTPEVLARKTLVAWLRGYLVGPHAGDDTESIYAGERRIYGDRMREVVQQTPYDFYHTGFLSPPHTEIDPEEDEQDGQEDDYESGAGESVMTLANAAQQSAMGLTFQSMDEGSTISVSATWGEYELTAREDRKEQLNDAVDGATASIPLEWKRVPHRLVETVRIGDLPQGRTKIVAREDGIVLLARRRHRQGLHFVTVSLINERKRSRGDADARIFQARVRVEASDSDSAFAASANTARRDEADFWTPGARLPKRSSVCSWAWLLGDVGHHDGARRYPQHRDGVGSRVRSQ